MKKKIWGDVIAVRADGQGKIWKKLNPAISSSHGADVLRVMRAACIL